MRTVSVVRRLGRGSSLSGAGKTIDGLNAAEHLSEAKRAWREGGRYTGLRHLRKALLLEPLRADLLYLSAQWNVDMCRSEAALDAVESALDVRPWHLDAIELLNELVVVGGHDIGLMSRALDRLAPELVGRVSLHQEALSLVVPRSHTACLDALADSPDQVAREAVGLFRNSGTYSTDAKSGRAELLYGLAVGRPGVADRLAELSDDAIPVASLRRAIRNRARAGDDDEVVTLTTQYLRARPSDGWATRVLREASAASAPSPAPGAPPTNYQLMRRGFPFSRKTGTAAYTAEPDRVLYLLHNSLPYSSAGYATRSHHLLRALNDHWSVQAVTRLGFPFDTPGNEGLETIPSRDVIDEVDYIRLSTSKGTWVKNPITSYVDAYARALAEHAMRRRPFVLHAASNHWNGLTAVELARRLGVRSVYEVRGLWEVTRGSRNPEWRDSGMYRYIARMEADAASKADRVITITGGLRDELVRRGVDERKITIVPNGVDSARFVPRKPDDELRRVLGLEGKTVIGYIGSVLDYEGIDLLIRAAVVLGGRRDDFHVLIVGDGAERKTYEELADRLGALGRLVTFTGRVPHETVGSYYSLVDIAPFPRLPLPVCEMVSPLKPLEAMAMGKAVVASDVKALQEMVSDGVTGLLHTKGDVDDLVRQLERLMDDADLRGRLGAGGRRWVAAERDWTVLSDKISDLYEELSPKQVDMLAVAKGR